MKKLLVLIFVLFFFCICAHAALAETRVRVGVYDNAPLVFTDTDGRVKGIYADIIAYVAKQEGWTIEYVQGTWEQCLMRLQNSRIDILCAMAYSEPRSRRYDFNSESLLTNWAQVYVPKGSGIKAITDLSGRKVAVLTGDIHYTNFIQLLKGFGITCDLLEFDDYPSVLESVHTGRADAGVVNRLFGMRFGEKYQLANSGIIFSPIKIYYGFPKGKHKPLAVVIDRHLGALKKDTNSVYYQSLHRWLGAVQAPAEGLPSWIKWVLPAGLAFIVLLLLGYLFSRSQVRIKTRELSEELEQRRRIEAELRESEEKYRMLVMSSNDVIYSIDPEFRMLTVSPQVERLLGYKPEDLIGRPFPELNVLAPEYLEQAFSDTLQVLSGKPITAVVYGFIAKDGTRKFGEVSGSPLFSGDKVVAIVSVARDITDRVQAEKALKQSEEKYRRIFENIQDVYYETALDGTILEISPSVEKFSLYKREDLIGKSLYDIYVDPKERDELVKLILDKGAAYDYEVRLKDKDGSINPYAISASLFRDASGAPVKLAGVMRDISARKQAEEEQKRLENQLRQAQKMEAIGALAGGIAHDFNNVLASIIGYTELSLDDLPQDSQAHKDMEEVLTAANRALKMVQQILTFSRQTESEKRPVLVQSVAKEAIRLLQTSIPKTIEIQQYLNGDCDPVLADPTQIHQVVMNLATNAYHAMRETGGVMEISVSEEQISTDDAAARQDLLPGRYVRLTVSDTGHGMDKALIDRIFDPYFTTKPTGQGTGMGLSVVLGIVKSHGGDIKVYSEPGEGTVFHVYFPVIRSKPVEQPPLPAGPVPTGTEHILFVDDDATIVSMAKLMLERLGYTVTTRTSSVEALEAFKAGPDRFDLVITDMTMPNMTGAALAPRLLAIRRDIPIILCTGFSELMDEGRAKALGIREFVMKPVVREQIAATIRKVLDARKAHQR